MLAAAVVLAAGAIVTVFAVVSHRPVQKLRQAQRSGSRASVNQQRIVQRLEDIAGHLERGAAIPRGTVRIRRLTAAQRRSLNGLVGLLRQELAALRTSSREVARTRSTAGLARLSAREARRLRQTIRTLSRIRAVAVASGA